MKCPVCEGDSSTLFSLAMHIEDEHPAEFRRATIAIQATAPTFSAPPPRWPATPSGFPGIDIDAVHRRRRDD